MLVTITTHDDGTLEVMKDGRTTGPLGYDEMLGQVATMHKPHRQLAPGGGLFDMRTPEEWEVWRRRFEKSEASE